MRPSNLWFSKPSKWFWWRSDMRAIVLTDNGAQSLRVWVLLSPRRKTIHKSGMLLLDFTWVKNKVLSCLSHQTFGNLPVSTAKVTLIHLKCLERGWEPKPYTPLTPDTENWNYFTPTYLILYINIYINMFLFLCLHYFSGSFFPRQRLRVHHRNFLKETLQSRTSPGILCPKILWIPSSKRIPCCFYQSWTVLSDLYPILIKSLHWKPFLSQTSNSQ